MDITIDIPQPHSVILDIRIDPTIQHVRLPSLLPETDVLTLNPRLGLLTRLVKNEQAAWPQIVAEQQFSLREFRLLTLLVHAYPNHCPIHVLLAHFKMENPPASFVESCRLRLQEAKHAGTWEHEMRLPRNWISVTRLKLHACGLSIGTLPETGCLLVPWQGRMEAKA